MPSTSPDDKLFAFICEEAEKNYPNESCGLILKKGKKQRFVSVPNTSTNPGSEFLMNKVDVEAAAEGDEIIAIWHTHCDESSKASQADIWCCEAMALPWVIVAIYKKEDGTFRFSEMNLVEPNGQIVEYVGRPYVFGALDCWTLIRDYYKREFDVVLGEYPRVPEFWRDPATDFFGNKDNWEAEGLYRIQESEMKKGDIIFFATDGSGKPNHAAVFVGNDLILHHATNRLSKHDVYYGYWEKNAVAFLRCKNVS